MLSLHPLLQTSHCWSHRLPLLFLVALHCRKAFLGMSGRNPVSLPSEGHVSSNGLWGFLRAVSYSGNNIFFRVLPSSYCVEALLLKLLHLILDCELFGVLLWRKASFSWFKILKSLCLLDSCPAYEQACFCHSCTKAEICLSSIQMQWIAMTYSGLSTSGGIPISIHVICLCGW